MRLAHEPKVADEMIDPRRHDALWRQRLTFPRVHWEAVDIRGCDVSLQLCLFGGVAGETLWSTGRNVCYHFK